LELAVQKFVIKPLPWCDCRRKDHRRERCWCWGWMVRVKAASFLVLLAAPRRLCRSRTRALTLCVWQQRRFRCLSGKVSNRCLAIEHWWIHSAAITAEIYDYGSTAWTLHV